MSDAYDPHERRLRNITALVYALQAAGFVVGITFIAAVVVNYVKRADVVGTLCQSHFDWQIRTFWWGLLWGFVGLLTFWFGVGFLVWIATSVWVVYRIVKGWLYLVDDKEVR
jgi:uncharacterized membrane protein